MLKANEDGSAMGDSDGDSVDVPTACLVGATVSARAIQEAVLPWLAVPLPEEQALWRVIDVRLPRQLSPMHWGSTHRTKGKSSIPPQAAAAQAALLFLAKEFPGRLSAYKLSDDLGANSRDDSALRCSVVVVHRVGGARDRATVAEVLRLMQRTVPRARVYTESSNTPS